MATNALRFIIEAIGQLWLLAVLLRFFAQAVRVPFRARAGNPLADFIMALTDWAVLPARRLVPSIRNFDLATFFVAWVASTLLALVVFALLGVASFAQPVFWTALISYAAVELIRLSIYLFIALMIIHAIFFWVSPYHPLQPFFAALTRPLLQPLRRFIPLIGGVDLSPLIAIILLQVILIGPVAFLSGEAKAAISLAALAYGPGQ